MDAFDAQRQRMVMERVARIELAWPAWKAGALPLSYTRLIPLIRDGALKPHPAIHIRRPKNSGKGLQGQDFKWELCFAFQVLIRLAGVGTMKPMGCVVMGIPRPVGMVADESP